MVKGDSEKRCFICSKRNPEHVHHMLHGSSGRTLAERYGLTCHLCSNCHSLVHDKGDYDKELQRIAQEFFEESHSREEWMDVFGKNYVMD